MKIIGTTERGFILEADEYEAANLVGFYSPSDCRAMLKVGAEIKVSEMFQQLYKIKDIRRNVKEIIENAKALTDCITTKMPVIEPVIAAVEAAQGKK